MKYFVSILLTIFSLSCQNSNNNIVEAPCEICVLLIDTLKEFQMPYYDYTKRVYIDSIYMNKGTLVIRAIGDTTYVYNVVSSITDLKISFQTSNFPRRISTDLYQIIKSKFLSSKYQSLRKEIGWTKLDYNHFLNTIFIGLEVCDSTKIKIFEDHIANSPIIVFNECGMGYFD